jgi:hypothetical protein
VLASLLISMLILGLKLTVPRDIVQLNQRRKELKANLAMLRRQLEGVHLKAWLDDVFNDVTTRQAKIDAMDLASRDAFSATENEAIERCMRMFALFDSYSGMKHARMRRAAGSRRSETKHDLASGLLLGLAEAEIRASPEEIIAFWLDDNSRYQKSIYAADANCVRAFGPTPINAHHAITFRRYKARGLTDRTFLNSVIAKRIVEDPPTYLIAIVPIARHDEITALDEAGAIRADVCRSFKLTAVASLVTKLEYVCSLDLRGFVPQHFTNTVAIPVWNNGSFVCVSLASCSRLRTMPCTLYHT